MTEDEYRGEFSVCQFFPNGQYEYFKRFVPAKEAVEAAHGLINSVGGRIGTTQRVIITDALDCLVWEWEHGKGITFPESLPSIPEPGTDENALTKTATILVYHALDLFKAWESAEQNAPIDLTQYALVAQLHSSNLQNAFYQTQNIEASWAFVEHPDLLVTTRAAQRSTSVGDILQIVGERFYMVTADNFVPVITRHTQSTATQDIYQRYRDALRGDIPLPEFNTTYEVLTASGSTHFGFFEERPLGLAFIDQKNQQLQSDIIAFRKARPEPVCKNYLESEPKDQR
jgi:hypothetical protein